MKIFKKLMIASLCFLWSINSQAQLFKYNGKTYDSGDLGGKFKVQLYELESNHHTSKQKVVELAVLDLYLAEVAKKEKKPLSAVRDRLLAVKEPSEKELKDFYEQNKNKIPYPYDQVKSQLIRFVKQQNTAKKTAELVEKAKKSGKFQFLIEAPKAPKIDINTKGFASKGKATSKITVVEFADYKCPHCRQAYMEFKGLHKKYGDKINFVFIDFPLSPVSTSVAEAAYCAKQQNKYWEFHALLYEKQKDVSLEALPKLAEEIKLNKDQFNKCVKNRDGKEFVEKGKAEGERVGVQATPTIFVNGQKATGGAHNHDHGAGHHHHHGATGETAELIKAALKVL